MGHYGQTLCVLGKPSLKTAVLKTL